MEIVIIIMHCTFLLAGPIGPPGLPTSENEMARTQIWVAPGHRAMCYVEPCSLVHIRSYMHLMQLNPTNYGMIRKANLLINLSEVFSITFVSPTTPVTKLSASVKG